MQQLDPESPVASVQLEPHLSGRVRSIPEALSIWMNQVVADLRAAGRDITVLSLGEAFFDIPWFGFDSIDADRANHYSDSRGLLELRERIASFHQVHYGVTVDPRRELLVTAGSKIAIYLAMLATLDPGDEVLIQEPAWLSYPEQARLAGAVPVFVPHEVAAADLPRWFTPRTRMVLLNNPNNPAGFVYSAGDLTALHAACCEHEIELVVDEAYSDFVLDGAFHSLGAVAPKRDHATLVNSLSKNLGMSGWRIGYLIGNPSFIDACLKLNQHLITCAPTPLQLYLARHFDALTAITLPQAQAVTAKRNQIARVMENLGLQRLAGAATFYFFVSIGSYEGTSLDFATDLLLDDDVAVVPGCAYGRSTDRFVRVSIGTESEERITHALERIARRVSRGPQRNRPSAERLLERGLRASGHEGSNR